MIRIDNNDDVRYYPGQCRNVVKLLLKYIKKWPQNITIITDGTCSGPCALFMAKITKLGKAQIVAIGGDTKYSNTTMVRNILSHL